MNIYLPQKTENWLLFRCVHGEFTPLSKPWKTTRLSEKARLRYPERERESIGLGVTEFRGSCCCFHCKGTHSCLVHPECINRSFAVHSLEKTTRAQLTTPE
jgi:hypothetical protein